MKLKKIQILKESEGFIFFKILVERSILFETFEKEYECFFDKQALSSRFFETGKLIENELNHSIKAWILCHE